MILDYDIPEEGYLVYAVYFFHRRVELFMNLMIMYSLFAKVCVSHGECFSSQARPMNTLGYDVYEV